MRKVFSIIVVLVFAVVVASYAMAPGPASTGQADGPDGKTFITDRTGEKWDVSQAANIGFDPRRFQYGIGRWAFETLDDSHLSDDAQGAPGRMRVIGITGKAENQAYSVRKMSRHEVANTNIDGKPIAVGY